MEWKSLDKKETTFSHSTDSHGWIQWKGTDVCMDVHCKECGDLTHIDADFLYFLECGNCGTVYELNGNIELIKRERKDVDGDIQKSQV